MSQIISIANQKGGVGKSTTAQALGAGLFFKGYKTLLIDLDPQGNTTYTTRTGSTGNTTYELLTGKASARDIIVKTDQGDIIPAGRNLSRADLELTRTGKEYRLKEALEPVRKEYDYIVIDTPPALGILTINALTASDSVVIPAQADIYSLQGIGQLIETMDVIKKYCNRDLKLQGILLTRHNSRTILSKDMAEMIEATAKELDTFVYKAVIREATAIKEAQANRQAIFQYSPKSKVSDDYTSFINELIEKGNHNNG